jgi:RNA polymerase subunit RPABC4/transcription elongation factor Spt4
MAAYNVCRNPKCATLVEGKADACPKCGGAMRSVGEAPWRGIVLLMCGLIMTVMMGVITINLYPELTNPGVRMPDGGSWTGGADSARMVLLLFFALIAFGLVAMANGIYMLVTKQQTKTFMFISLGTVAVVLVIAYFTVGKIKSEKSDEPERTYYGG